MHLLMFFLYFVEAGESIPFTICWCEDRFIRKWTSTAASEGSKCLIKSVILKKAEKEPVALPGIRRYNREYD